MLSVVIPAFNEAQRLPRCLESVRESARECGLSDYEIVVCDNASTDDTARLARETGARVVHEPIRRISRSRNAGAAAAKGEWLLFVDADSWLRPPTLRGMLDAASSGTVVGGGSTIGFDRLTWWAWIALAFWTALSLSMRWAAGSFVFCRADAFREVGGFPAEVAAGEEIYLSRALTRWGRARGLRFVVLTGAPHLSSGRKFESYSLFHYLRAMTRLLISPRRGLRDNAFHDYLYDDRR